MVGRLNLERLAEQPGHPYRREADERNPDKGHSMAGHLVEQVDAEEQDVRHYAADDSHGEAAPGQQLVFGAGVGNPTEKGDEEQHTCHHAKVVGQALTHHQRASEVRQSVDQQEPHARQPHHGVLAAQGGSDGQSDPCEDDVHHREESRRQAAEHGVDALRPEVGNELELAIGNMQAVLLHDVQQICCHHKPREPHGVAPTASGCVGTESVCKKPNDDGYAATKTYAGPRKTEDFNCIHFLFSLGMAV